MSRTLTQEGKSNPGEEKNQSLDTGPGRSIFVPAIELADEDVKNVCYKHAPWVQWQRKYEQNEEKMEDAKRPKFVS